MKSKDSKRLTAAEAAHQLNGKAWLRASRRVDDCVAHLYLLMQQKEAALDDYKTTARALTRARGDKFFDMPSRRR